MLDDTFTIGPFRLDPCPVNLFIRLTNAFEIQILTGHDLAITLSASMHCRDLFSASWRCIDSLRHMTSVCIDSAENNAGTLVIVSSVIA
jgi:hypothetical protein